MTRIAQRKALYEDALRAGRLGVVVNLGLGVAKLAGGLAGFSVALIADSINSLGDVVASLVVIYGLRVSQRPADDEHPYGHTKAETVAATNVALLIILSAFAVAWKAGTGLGVAGPPPAAWTLWIAGGTVVIKEGLYRYKRRVAARTGSNAVLASAWDHRGDAFASLAVIVGIAAVRYGGPGFAWGDKAAALLVAVAVVWTGVQLFRQGASALLDRQADAPLLAAVEAAARGVFGVRDVETLRLRASGIEHFADIHIEVDPALTVAAGHLIGHEVKDAILVRFPHVRDVLVHVEPAGRRD